jgi:hypothetical protein
MNKRNQTNVIVTCVPQRYDLERSSCVNQEVESVQQKTKKVYEGIL